MLAHYTSTYLGRYVRRRSAGQDRPRLATCEFTRSKVEGVSVEVETRPDYTGGLRAPSDRIIIIIIIVVVVVVVVWRRCLLRSGPMTVGFWEPRREQAGHWSMMSVHHCIKCTPYQRTRHASRMHARRTDYRRLEGCWSEARQGKQGRKEGRRQRDAQASKYLPTHPRECSVNNGRVARRTIGREKKINRVAGFPCDLQEAGPGVPAGLAGSSTANGSHGIHSGSVPASEGQEAAGQVGSL